MPKTGTIQVATGQFAVSADPRRNGRAILRLMRQARDGGAEAVHFCEAALSGYAGVDFKSWGNYPWDELRRQTEEIIAESGRLRLWTILGSSHPLTPPNLPHNCLYVIGPDGSIHDRYDKRFLTPGDLSNYSAGDHWTTFDIRGVRCAALICFDVRFPEVYRAVRALDVQMIFQSFHNARMPRPPERPVHRSIMRQTAQAHCGMNAFWMSLSNSSAWYSAYPSALIAPDGIIERQLPMNRSGLMINTVDTRRNFYDLAAGAREAAMAGQMHNGSLPAADARSRDRRGL
jgi:deaminated glutathione amidase